MRFSRYLAGAAAIGMVAGVVGCSQADKPAITYPPNTLPVRYEFATLHTTCLVASVAMAANYLVGERRFTEASIREELQAKKLDETKVDDLRVYLEEKKFYLITLAGAVDGKPPVSMRYWLYQRGYPVICVINREGEDAAFNHAVVVTGIQHTDPTVSADKIVYLDPAASHPLLTDEAANFEALWERGQHAMMIVVAPPPGSQPSQAGPKENP